MSSFSVIAGRDTLLAGRASCDIGDPDCHLADNRTFVTVQAIYVIVATAIFLLGCGLSVFLIMRQRRRVRERQLQMGKLADPSNVPVYDPSVGRPVQNVWPGGMPQPAEPVPPPTYSQV